MRDFRIFGGIVALLVVLGCYALILKVTWGSVSVGQVIFWSVLPFVIWFVYDQILRPIAETHSLVEGNSDKLQNISYKLTDLEKAVARLEDAVARLVDPDYFRPRGGR